MRLVDSINDAYFGKCSYNYGTAYVTIAYSRYLTMDYFECEHHS